MATVTVHEAKTHLSRLIARALDGEEVVIARGKEPKVKLVPIDNAKPKKRVLGGLDGRIRATHDAFDPLTDNELREMGLL